MHRRPHVFLAAALALSSSCLETEEEIQVAPDGSVDVRIAAKGGRADFADGYPLPVDGAESWSPSNEETRIWRAHFARPDAGAEMPTFGLGGNDELRLEVRGRFRSVEELPRSFAPRSDPYREAYLARTTSLSVEQRGERTVYRFERVFAGRPQTFLFVDGRMKQDIENLPETIEAKLNDDGALDEAEWKIVCAAIEKAVVIGAEVLARNALAAIYTEGDASLSLAAYERILRAVVAAARDAVRLEAFIEWEARGRRHEEDDPFSTLEDRVRTRIREALALGLDAERVPREVRNAVLRRQEELYAETAHSDDLRDDELVLRVHLPGRIVGGNFTDVEDGAAVWRIEGDQLRSGAAVLRAVSVLE